MEAQQAGTQGATYVNSAANQIDKTLGDETVNNSLRTTLLVCGFASIAISLGLQLSGKNQAALFVGQWPPTFFILAVGAQVLKS